MTSTTDDVLRPRPTPEQLPVARTTFVSVPSPSRGDALSFSVVASVGDDDPETAELPEGAAGQSLPAHYAVVDVQAWVNGRRLTLEKGLCFDAIRVLVRRDTPCLFDLYTCGCGVAGCAGLFRGMRQGLAEAEGRPMDDALAVEVHPSTPADTVVWRFPLDEDGFMGRLNDGLTVVDGAYEVRFDRAHFAVALNALHAHLSSLETVLRTDFDAPMTVMPDYDPARARLAQRPLLERLPELRAQFENYQESIAQQKATYGALYHQYLSVTLPMGRVYSLHPTRLALILADLALGENADLDAQNALVREVIAPAWRDNPSTVVDSVKTLTWPILDQEVVLDAYGPSDGNGDTVQVLDDAAMQDQWARATYTWCPLNQD